VGPVGPGWRSQDGLTAAGQMFCCGSVAGANQWRKVGRVEMGLKRADGACL
jgi:hypothetical protein